MPTPSFSTVLDGGALLILAGVSMIYAPAALVLAGLMLFGASYLFEAEKRQPTVPAERPRHEFIDDVPHVLDGGDLADEKGNV